MPSSRTAIRQSRQHGRYAVDEYCCYFALYARQPLWSSSRPGSFWASLRVRWTPVPAESTSEGRARRGGEILADDALTILLLQEDPERSPEKRTQPATVRKQRLWPERLQSQYQR